MAKNRERQLEIEALKEAIQFQKSQIQCLESRLCSMESQPLLNLPPCEKSELLEHISKQELQLNKLSFTFNTNRQTIFSLQHHISVLMRQIQELKGTLSAERSNSHKLQAKCQHLMRIVNEQQYELTQVLQKYNQKNIQLDVLEEEIEGLKEQIADIRD